MIIQHTVTRRCDEYTYFFCRNRQQGTFPAPYVNVAIADQPDQPATITQLQALIDVFAAEYNQHRPHRSLPHRATPATVYTTLPKTSPHTNNRTRDSHDRVRKDKIDTPAASPCA